MFHIPHRPGTKTRRSSSRVDVVTAAITTAVIGLLVIAGNGTAPDGKATAPPDGGSAHGAAGSGRNGFGGSIAPSPTMKSWPGTGSDGNGGPFSFIGAHYGSMWRIPAAHNNSRGIGYCVMEDVAGESTISLQPDPAVWDAGEMARAAALMSSFGGDRVVPYGIDSTAPYDVASGEWQHPSLFGGGEYTRRRHIAVNFGVKMFLEDVSPSGAVAGLKLARDTSVVNGSGSESSALRNGYTSAQRLASVADVQHAVGGVHLRIVWAHGSAPTETGTHSLEVRAADATGKPVGFIPIVAMSDIGIDGARTFGATVTVDRTGDTADDTARWNAAAALGWPTMEMAASMGSDPRFVVATNPSGADVTDASGTARFSVTIVDDSWELAFHTQAPTADVALYSGTGIQGQVTWTGRPQSASVHVRKAPPPPPPELGAFAVRKVLDATDVQGARDMSGFEFEVTSSDATSVGRLTTAADGRTPRFEAIAGRYTISETARPPWAGVLGDGGPVTIDVESTSDSDEREIVYLNTVPDASIATAARDAADGDQVIDLERGDATIVDTVTYLALVPGTDYLVTGELMVRPTDAGRTSMTADNPSTTSTIHPGTIDNDTVASSTVELGGMIATGIASSQAFVPIGPDGSVDVEFAVPANSPLRGNTIVVFQRVVVASSGRVVATHADPDALEQTIRVAVPTPPTSTTIAVEPPPPPTTSPATSPTTSPPTSPATSPPSSTAPPTSPPATPPTLPRTGTDGSRSLATTALTLLLLGVALLSVARRPIRRSR